MQKFLLVKEDEPILPQMVILTYTSKFRALYTRGVVLKHFIAIQINGRNMYVLLRTSKTDPLF